MRHLLTWSLLTAALIAQPTLTLQDLTVQTIATGIQHAGDIEVDTQGNVWVIQIQGTVGGTQGRMTRVSPSGVLTTGLGAPLSEMGSMVRSNVDGFIYYWMNSGGGTAQLCQLLPGGAITTIQSYPGHQALGICQDAQGRFYMGTKIGSSFTGIRQRNSFSGALTNYSTGIPGGDHRLLEIDSQGVIYAANQQTIYRCPQGGTATVHYQANGQGGTGFIRDFDLGYFGLGHFMVAERAVGGPQGNTERLLGLTPEPFATAIADLGTIPGNAGPTAICRDLPGTGYYVLMNGTLYRITGTPCLLTVGSPSPTQLTTRVDHIGNAPFILAADTPGINIPAPPFGNFATSLGTGPGWFLLLDGIGAFQGADPFGQCPFTFTVNNPTPAGITVALQAYILDVGAANGILMISNVLNVGI